MEIFAVFTVLAGENQHQVVCYVSFYTTSEMTARNLQNKKL